MVIIINNVHDLMDRIEEYRRMFPKTYTTFEEIKNCLEKNAEGPCGGVFGIEVSSEWEDRCYGFEVDRVTPKCTYFQFLGMWKS